MKKDKNIKKKTNEEWLQTEVNTLPEMTVYVYNRLKEYLPKPITVEQILNITDEQWQKMGKKFCDKVQSTKKYR